MENDTEDPQSERQVEEVSSFGGGAVIEMQEFSDICRASARLPAFLPTTPRIPSRLEGK